MADLVDAWTLVTEASLVVAWTLCIDADHSLKVACRRSIYVHGRSFLGLGARTNAGKEVCTQHGDNIDIRKLEFL